MKLYKIIINSLNQEIIQYRGSQGLVCFANPSPGNSDYEQYLAWLAEGNMPEPPDPQPEPVDVPTMQEEIKALKLIVGMLMEEDGDV